MLRELILIFKWIQLASPVIKPALLTLSLPAVSIAKNFNSHRKMRIGMITLWNAANGPSIHAELIGRSWTAMGYPLTVFAPIRHPDARPTLQKDEPYVIRHYTVDSVHPYTRASWFDPKPLLKTDYQVFVAQNVERLPSEQLLKLFPKIREKAVTVMVVHEGGPPEDPLYYQFQWDAIVCFDHRYVEFIAKYFPKDIIHIIPYPCHPMKLGDRIAARRALNLPLERPIIFSYGFRQDDVIPVLPELEEVAKETNLLYLVVANPGGEVEKLRKLVSQYDFVELRVKPLPLHELYTYLHASNALLINRAPNIKYRAVLSSSIHLTLGSGCPILVRDSNYVELNNGEVIKYKDYKELKEKLIKVINVGFDLEPVVKYVEERRADKIAEKFIKLFEKLLEESKR